MGATGEGRRTTASNRRLRASRQSREATMSDKIETVRSSSSGSVGRAVSHARGQRLVLDSSTKPQADALTNSEAFLAGISSCGVTLIEGHAQETGVALRHMDVTIEGVRTAADPARFARISMTFEMAGVSQAQADELLATYQRR
jgi:uncharacterized OsmC-like protein